MKLWGGRFSKSTADIVDGFNASIAIDKELYRCDILGSIAHAKMLGKSEIIELEESKLIVDTLQEILVDIENGEIEFKIEYEDIHMNIESILIERIGNVGKKLHTARSRNDQVAVDIRIYLKMEIENIKAYLKRLMKTIIDISKENMDTILPGYTHLQRAQPIRLSYHFMAYFQMFKRDYERLEDCYTRVDYLPLGAGALAGTSYLTDREFLASELGFSNICENSLDAVSDRDFVIEFIGAASMISMHLSRFCEELILWSSSEFGFVEIDDSYSTGSSIMPQKKNPDIAELIRGKTGRIYGDLFSILTVMKSLPLAYNKDMQEDKEPLFDTVNTIKECIDIFEKMICTLTFNKNEMRESAELGFMNATDVADYLSKKGVPFRQAHEIVGKMVLYCIENTKKIKELSLDELNSFSMKFEIDLFEKTKLENCIEAKVSYGSTSYKSVNEMIKSAEQFLILKK